MKSLLSLATSLLVALASASLLVACTVNADDQAAPSDDPQPAAAVETAAQPADVAPEPEPASESPAATESEQQTQTTQPADVEAAPEPPSRPAAEVQVRANTPRKDTAQPVASAMLQRALAKSFYTFGEFATLDLPPNLIVAWGLGAPRGAYVISASIWTATAQGAQALSDTELLSGGTLRSDEATPPRRRRNRRPRLARSDRCRRRARRHLRPAALERPPTAPRRRPFQLRARERRCARRSR